MKLSLLIKLKLSKLKLSKKLSLLIELKLSLLIELKLSKLKLSKLKLSKLKLRKKLNLLIKLELMPRSKKEYNLAAMLLALLLLGNKLGLLTKLFCKKNLSVKRLNILSFLLKKKFFVNKKMKQKLLKLLSNLRLMRHTTLKLKRFMILF